MDNRRIKITKPFREHQVQQYPICKMEEKGPSLSRLETRFSMNNNVFHNSRETIDLQPFVQVLCPLLSSSL